MSRERSPTDLSRIAAPREFVWRAFSEPEHLAQWWGPKGFRNTFHEFDLRPGGHWVFSVADDGIGVPEDADVFGLFERGREARRYSGSGIGLAICQRVVERHGGRIWHHPSDGGGSTFCFTLPA